VHRFLLPRNSRPPIGNHDLQGFFVGTRPNGFTLEPMSDEDWKRLVVTEEDLARMAVTITPTRSGSM
jgi:hypothetical protein